jgi:AcrR family transcriptional regulator
MPRKTSPRKASPPSSPRSPRKPAAPAPRAAQIVAAAFEEFSAHGFAATRLDDVARRAGVAKGTIYLHFKNKEVLFQAVVRSLIRPLFEEFGGAAGEFGGSAEDLLRQFLSRLYAGLVRSEKARRIVRLLIAESGNFPQVAEIYRREVIEPGLGAIRLVLDKGCGSGEFERTRARDFPQILLAPAILAVVWMLVVGKRQPLDLDAYFAAHLEFVLRALKLPPGSRKPAAPRSDES